MVAYLEKTLAERMAARTECRRGWRLDERLVEKREE